MSAKPLPCPKCGGERVYQKCNVRSNGSSYLAARCVPCRRKRTNIPIKERPTNCKVCGELLSVRKTRLPSPVYRAPRSYCAPCQRRKWHERNNPFIPWCPNAPDIQLAETQATWFAMNDKRARAILTEMRIWYGPEATNPFREEVPPLPVVKDWYVQMCEELGVET